MPLIVGTPREAETKKKEKQTNKDCDWFIPDVISYI